MKLRALPESFWKEPHSIQSSSLARSNYSVLPPLFSGSKESEVMNVRPVTPPDERGRSPRHSPRNKKKWVMTSPPDTGLLFSLFDHLENNVDERLIVKRGRYVCNTNIIHLLLTSPKKSVTLFVLVFVRTNFCVFPHKNRFMRKI